MYVSEPYRLVYMAAPRTGSSSVTSRLLEEPFEAQFYSEDGSPYHTQWHSRFDGYQTLLTVRHPYVRAVSLWRWGCFQAICKISTHSTRFWKKLFTVGLPNLEGFLKYPELIMPLNTSWRCSWHLERIPDPVTHVLHLERLEAEAALVPALKDVSFPRLGVGPPSKHPWHYFYEQLPVCEDIVQRLWCDDFDEFGYNRDMAQCREGKLLLDNTEEGKVGTGGNLRGDSGNSLG